MFLRKLLFNTKAGERFLAWLEKAAGLALVEADWLAEQPGGSLPPSVTGDLLN